MAARTFASEFRSGYDIPDFIRFLVKEGVIEDQSWHNDVSPSFGVEGVVKGTRSRPQGSETAEFRLWVEHPLKRFREMESKRFFVTYSVSNTQKDGWEFDELHDALEKLFAEIAKNEPTLEELPKAWSDLMADYDGDPKEILGGLIEKYWKKR